VFLEGVSFFLTGLTNGKARAISELPFPPLAA